MAAAGVRGLTPGDVKYLRDFSAVLSSFDACANADATRSLRRALHGFKKAEFSWWRAPVHGVWRSTHAGAPCNDTVRWWVEDASGDMVWHAHPMWAHCCNKGPSVAKCPRGQLIEPPMPRCFRSTGRLTALKGHCQADATMLCQPFVERLGSRTDTRRPLVYSFGIANEWDFEDYMGSRGFEVHAFDPTSRFRDEHEKHSAPNVHFHFMGLGARGGAAGRMHFAGYGSLGGEVLALDELTERLGHGDRDDQRPISLLKIDCEGCEWEAFVDVAVRAPHLVRRVCTLILEVHVTRSLQMNTTADLGRMAAFWRHYVVEAGFRFWFMHSNPGAEVDRTVHPTLRSFGLDPSTCCYEIGLYRDVPQCA